MIRLILLVIFVIVSFSAYAEDEAKVETKTLNGQEAIQILKEKIWGRQVDGNTWPGDCVVDLMIASDEKLAEIVFRDEKTSAPINYTESNQNNPGRFWFASGFNYIYVKSDYSTEDDGPDFWVTHEFKPALAPEKYSVIITEAGDSYYELSIKKNNQEVSKEALCNVDF